jgi:hypothetical protein
VPALRGEVVEGVGVGAVDGENTSRRRDSFNAIAVHVKMSTASSGPLMLWSIPNV